MNAILLIAIVCQTQIELVGKQEIDPVTCERVVRECKEDKLCKKHLECAVSGVAVESCIE